jgi:hypothetical protein
MTLIIPRSKGDEVLNTRLDNVSASGTAYVVAHTTAKVKAAYAAIDGAIATGNATLTMSINGTAVTNGVITITQSGSAAGNMYSCTPSALNTVKEGDVISFVQGGTSTGTVKAYITIVVG